MANAADLVEDSIEEMLEAIDDQIQAIDNHKIVRAAEKLLEKKARLQSARRALLGVGSKTTSSGGTKVTQGEVIAWLEANPGSHTVSKIAGSLGHSEGAVRGHLNRGKGERFHKHEDGTWSLRDPENEED